MRIGDKVCFVTVGWASKSNRQPVPCYCYGMPVSGAVDWSLTLFRGYVVDWDVKSGNAEVKCHGFPGHHFVPPSRLFATLEEAIADAERAFETFKARFAEQLDRIKSDIQEEPKSE